MWQRLARIQSLPNVKVDILPDIFSVHSRMAPECPSIPDWFAKKNVLITGGTGFMGKVLVSKLLLSCPDIGNIYLIIRKKKGLDAQTRLHQMLQVLFQVRLLRRREENRERRLKFIYPTLTGLRTFETILILMFAKRDQLRWINTGIWTHEFDCASGISIFYLHRGL